MSSKKSNLSRERIGETALAIADKHGFEAVTMRRIAQELKVGTMSLYYYVKAKDDLIAVMDDALMGEILLPTVPQKWRRALLQIAERTHAMLVRHPWALVTMMTAPPGLNAMRHFEQCLEALAYTSMTPAQKLTLLALVDDFVFGHALREASNRTPPDAKFATAQLATGNFPRIKEVLAKAQVKIDARGNRERLKKGLAALLDAGAI
jgi:AcrR family transcriptional regulator